MILYHARFEVEIQKHVFTLQSGKNSACKNFFLCKKQWGGLALIALMWKKKQFVTAFYHVFLNNWRSILLNSFLEIFPSVYKIRIDCAFDIFIWRAWCHINVLEKFSLGYLSTVALGFT